MSLSSLLRKLCSCAARFSANSALSSKVLIVASFLLTTSLTLASTPSNSTLRRSLCFAISSTFSSLTISSSLFNPDSAFSSEAFSSISVSMALLLSVLSASHLSLSSAITSFILPFSLSNSAHLALKEPPSSTLTFKALIFFMNSAETPSTHFAAFFSASLAVLDLIRETSLWSLFSISSSLFLDDARYFSLSFSANLLHSSTSAVTPASFSISSLWATLCSDNFRSASSSLSFFDSVYRKVSSFILRSMPFFDDNVASANKAHSLTVFLHDCL
mmetsp:Transcript_21918/g.45657  ORF Transcript_21918/g.45657 Transcript_21918/m.45657 type:complete len:274 (+) Transcript_21918:1163-1984(+)